MRWRLRAKERSSYGPREGGLLLNTRFCVSTGPIAISHNKRYTLVSIHPKISSVRKTGYQCAATTNNVFVTKHVIITTTPYNAKARLNCRNSCLRPGIRLKSPLPLSRPASSSSSESSLSSASSFMSFW